MCIECFGTLTNIRGFKNKCLATEKFVRNYLTVNHLPPGSVSLENIVRPSLEFCEVNVKTEPSFYLDESVTETQGKFVCGVCKKSFNRKVNLSVHERSHSEERPFQCHLCDKAFPFSINLTSHMRSHDGEGPPTCQVCNREFVKKVQLRRHMVIHSEEKLFKCEVCDKDFRHKVSLVRHLALHKDERAFKCHICDKEFQLLAYLQNHLKGHDELKLYKCEVGKTYFYHFRLHKSMFSLYCDLYFCSWIHNYVRYRICSFFYASTCLQIYRVLHNFFR